MERACSFPRQAGKAREVAPSDFSGQGTAPNPHSVAFFPGFRKISEHNIPGSSSQTMTLNYGFKHRGIFPCMRNPSPLPSLLTSMCLGCPWLVLTPLLAPQQHVNKLRSRLCTQSSGLPGLLRRPPMSCWPGAAGAPPQWTLGWVGRKGRLSVGFVRQPLPILWPGKQPYPFNLPFRQQ